MPTTITRDRLHRSSLLHGHRLQLTPIVQDGPTSCTNACLRMVAGYFGRKLDRDEIDRALFKDSAGCSFNTDIARFALRHGFAAECYGYNLYLTDPADGGLAPSALLSKLRREQAHLRDQWYRPMLASIVAALAEGVRYVVRRPAFEIAAGYLRQRIPVIAVVSYPALHGVRGNPFSGHDVVLTGYDGRRVYFVDPLHGDERSVTRAHFMFALHSRSAIGTSDYFTVVRPPAGGRATIAAVTAGS
jgi:predicted double-glycine peptidase